ncbi:MAG TPA: hypothetical protein VKZ43_01430 [Trueperaceae bacterium]|nr:hypothetical protein [Trueperaceae bacterium]
MKLARNLALLVGLVAMLAACQNPTPQISFEGTSTVAGVGYDLRLVVDRHGDRLTGVYEVAVAGGSFSGTVDGTELTAELKSSEACVYSFTGTLGETSLTGWFEPSACPSGTSGVWSLDRK